MQLGADHRSDRFKLGSNVLFEVLFEFQVLATGMGHDDEGTEKWRVGSKNLQKNDRYECDKGEERNPME
jgi:hypothetical protein